MNVYVRELCQALGARGFALDVFTRRASSVAPEVQPFGPNARVIDIDAGPAERIDKNDLPEHLEDVRGGQCSPSPTRGPLVRPRRQPLLDVGRRRHRAWPSAGHVPHVAMFHTLGEVKNRARTTEHEPPARIDAERVDRDAADAIVVASGARDATCWRSSTAPTRRRSPSCRAASISTSSRRSKRKWRAHKLGLKDGERIILFVGRIEPLKGIDILIGAAAQLHENENFRVLIVGGDDSALRSRSRSCARRRAARTSTTTSLRRRRAHGELPLYYNAADVCVVPSFYESFGLVAVESMACGTPVVASRVGGLASTVIDGETGYLISWRCPEPFAERLELLLDNDELRASFGRAAREAVERYRWPNVAGAVSDLYQSLLARARA